MNFILNIYFWSRENSLEPKIVRKMMRYLPKRFHTKVIIIEESKYLDTIKVDAFVGSLQKFWTIPTLD